MTPSNILLITTLILLHLTPSISSSISDPAILLRVKHDQLLDPDNRLSNWHLTRDHSNNNTHPRPHCNWTGITCDSLSSIIAVNLNSLRLSGTFPSGFCRIPTLRNLSISDNEFNTTIPTPSLSLCSNLHSLNVSINDFTGNLPDFSPEFTSLFSLDFSGNAFSGKIPRSFRHLSSLRVLHLFGNYLDGPALPEFLTSLTLLTHLELASNLFSPSVIPTTIRTLLNLEVLWISDANLTGNIPESVCELQSLRQLDVSKNSLTGEIPRCIGNLTNLWLLELYQNQLTGELPESMENLKNLLFFDASQNILTGILPEKLAAIPFASLCLNDNFLSGKIPAVLAEHKNLFQLKLFNNSFSGELPANWGSNAKLVEFDVSTNNISGEFPANLCNGGHLSVIIAFNNKFSGNFPATYGNCSSIWKLRIQNNNFSGEFPRNIWSLPQLGLVEIEGNKFEGTLPSTISKPRNLTTLRISDNMFSGSLTPGFCELKDLMILTINENRFSGELPRCITQMEGLQILQLQGNMFTGEFPSNVSAWVQLTEMNLSRNKFSGEIPSQIGNLPVLTFLDLSNNSFSGEIPVDLTKLKLNRFNLSYNNLEGVVPLAFRSEFYVDGLMGNPKLCTRSSDPKPFPRCPKSTPVLFLVSFISVLSFVLLTSIFLLCITKLQSNSELGRRFPFKITAYQRGRFDEQEILSQLTQCNVIGSGGSGQVYRVVLQSGCTIAVKKLWSGGNRSSDMGLLFKAEVETLGSIRHGNVVKLMFSCIGENFMALGYDYMKNGSLGNVLHGDKGGALLDWPRRYAIALGTARGLAYLHHDCVPAIIHRDVKSNNILLDDKFLPRVADFGLAKLVSRPRGVQNGESIGAMSQIAGSCGYIAPEYCYTLKVTEKSDVYSFGVVLMELVTGKRPNDPSFGENKDIVKWMTEAVLESQEFNQAKELIDPRMNQATCNYADIHKVIEVAILCTSATPMKRPSMRRVVELLMDHAALAMGTKSSSSMASYR